MKADFIKNFDEIYAGIRKKPVIKRHHQKYINDKYTPAWKTIEYMTFGNIEKLYGSLLSIADKLEICHHFGVNQTAIFENYISTIRTLRNTCAHGGILFDLRLPMSIKNGPAGCLGRENGHNLYGALKVVEFFISHISQNRLRDMREQIRQALDRLYLSNPDIEQTVKKTAGILNY